MRKGVTAAAGYSAYVFILQEKKSLGENFAYCESSNPNLPEEMARKRPCKFYNSSFQKIWWRERRNRCNAQQGCNFTGWSITGTCNSDISRDERGDEKLRPIEEYVSKLIISIALPVIMPNDAAVSTPVKLDPVVEELSIDADAGDGMTYSLLGDVTLQDEKLHDDLIDAEFANLTAPPVVKAAPPVIIIPEPVIAVPPRPNLTASLRQLLGERATSTAALSKFQLANNSGASNRRSGIHGHILPYIRYK